MPHGEPAYWSSTAKPTPRGQASAPNLKDYNAARRYPSMLDKNVFLENSSRDAVACREAEAP